MFSMFLRAQDTVLTAGVLQPCCSRVAAVSTKWQGHRVGVSVGNVFLISLTSEHFLLFSWASHLWLFSCHSPQLACGPATRLQHACNTPALFVGLSTTGMWACNTPATRLQHACACNTPAPRLQHALFVGLSSTGMWVCRACCTLILLNSSSSSMSSSPPHSSLGPLSSSSPLQRVY